MSGWTQTVTGWGYLTMGQALSTCLGVNYG